MAVLQVRRGRLLFLRIFMYYIYIYIYIYIYHLCSIFRERNAELEQSKDVEKTPANTTNNTGSNKQKKEDRWVEGRTSEWRYYIKLYI